jgi:hypothetical protein
MDRAVLDLDRVAYTKVRYCEEPANVRKFTATRVLQMASGGLLPAGFTNFVRGTLVPGRRCDVFGLTGITYLAPSYGIAAMDQSEEGYQSVLSQLARAVVPGARGQDRWRPKCGGRASPQARGRLQRHCLPLLRPS